MSKPKEDNRIIRLLIAICGLFLILIGYLTYFQLFRGAGMLANTYNRRQWDKEISTLRGKIYDRDGVVLAESREKNGGFERVYPYRSLYCHVIGYDSSSYGRTQLEAGYNDYLLGLRGIGSVFNFNLKTQGKRQGDSLYLSIDNRLQKLADEQLKGRNGAIVVMDPKTGEILAMVSKPDFDPNGYSLSQRWQDLVEASDHPFYSRAVQGLYAPGSTFKIVTAAAAVQNGLDGMKIKDGGSVTIGGKKISNSGGEVFGSLDIGKAMAVSSNVFFAQLGANLGYGSMKEEVSRFGIGKDIPFDIPVQKSAFPGNSDDPAELAALGIGQGKLLVTPLQMALVTSCIANDGVIMKPRLVTKAVAPDGETDKEWKADVLYRAIPASTAGKVAGMLRKVVESGTGTRAAVKGIHVAGKTGTAENELTVSQNNKEHAWFTGYAPYEDPKVVVTVILEYSGSTGGKAAAPIAAKLIKAALAG